LTARPGTVDMRAPRAVRTYTYDNIVPGYTWEIRPGDTLKVDLLNHLPALENPGPMVMDRPHDWTTTNLHTHGLHVSPKGNSDNVFISIPPGQSFQYRYDLPENHPAGTFWYHPHHHGAVTQQVRAGMAGVIIVRGDIDEVEEVRAAKEHIMVLQGIELGNDYQLLDPIPNPTKEQAFFPRTNFLYTVNGVLKPTITMYPGEVQRWRLLNAAEGKFMSLRLTKHDLHVLAWDGLTLPAAETAELVMLSPANRVDVLVQAGAPGVYDLMLTPGSSQKPDIPGMSGSPGPAATPSPSTSPSMSPMPGMPIRMGELVTRSIARIEVSGQGPKMGLPTGLPAWDPPMLPVIKRRQFSFTVERDPAKEFLSFGVDGLVFDPNRAPYQAKLNTAEEWTLVNALDTKLMEHAHAFHIHVNPFRVTKINGRTLPIPLWRDTFVLPEFTGNSITFESNFVDFTGKFVEHCHVLSHEDLGMMASVEVVA
ncbi:MAG: multicopper oxidase family protein, partial [Candidatus Dormibacteraceae bacterium]